MNIKQILKTWQRNYLRNKQTRLYKKAFLKAKKLADDRKLLTSKRQVVMLDYNHKFVVFSRDEFLLMRRRGRFDKRFTWSDALKNANYKTD